MFFSIFAKLENSKTSKNTIENLEKLIDFQVLKKNEGRHRIQQVKLCIYANYQVKILKTKNCEKM